MGRQDETSMDKGRKEMKDQAVKFKLQLIQLLEEGSENGLDNEDLLGGLLMGISAFLFTVTPKEEHGNVGEMIGENVTRLLEDMNRIEKAMESTSNKLLN